MKKIQPINILLWPAAQLYGLAVWIRNCAFDLGILPQEEFPVTIVVIGNLEAGGTGKTPHVIYLTEQLKSKYRIAILSRGYKRKSKGFQWVQSGVSWKNYGDEPMEIKEAHPDIPVGVDKNRRRGIAKILKEINPPPQIILMDDGFQHRYVKPDVSLLLSRMERPYFADRLLPLGRLREPRSATSRGDFIINTRKTGQGGNRPADRQKLTHLGRGVTEPRTTEVNSQATMILPNITNNVAVLLVTGIAHSEVIVNELTQMGVDLIHMKFSDHHEYSPQDIQEIMSTFRNIESVNKCILTTRKDAVKLNAFDDFVNIDLKIISLRMEMEAQDLSNILSRIDEHVKEYQ